jgi:hypothetical protein
MGRTVRGSNPGRNKTLFSSPKRPERLWGTLSLLLKWCRSYFPEVKQPERKVDHSPPSSAEVKNEWSYTFTSLIYIYGIDRDNFSDDSGLEIAILTSYISRDSGSK